MADGASLNNIMYPTTPFPNALDRGCQSCTHLLVSRRQVISLISKGRLSCCICFVAPSLAWCYFIWIIWCHLWDLNSNWKWFCWNFISREKFMPFFLELGDKDKKIGRWRRGNVSASFWYFPEFCQSLLLGSLCYLRAPVWGSWAMAVAFGNMTGTAYTEQSFPLALSASLSKTDVYLLC